MLLLIPGQASAAVTSVCCRGVPLRSDQQHPRDGLGHAFHDDAVRERAASRRAALPRARSARRRQPCVARPANGPQPRSHSRPRSRSRSRSRSRNRSPQPEPEQEPELAAKPRRSRRLSWPRNLPCHRGPYRNFPCHTGDQTTDQPMYR